MEARYYGYCPLAPGTVLIVSRWVTSPAGHIVLLEFEDQHGIRWIGPEFPRDPISAYMMRNIQIQNKARKLDVRATKIDAIVGCTDFEVEEKL